MPKAAGTHLRKCTDGRGHADAQAQRGRPAGAARGRSVGPLRHRRRGTRHQPHHHLAPHRRPRRAIGGRLLARVAGRLGAHRPRPRAHCPPPSPWRPRCAPSPRIRRAPERWKAWSGCRRRTASARTSPRPPPRGAEAPPEGGGGDRRHHPARDAAALGSRHRGGRRRTPGAPRRGHPSRRLPVGSVRLARLPRPARQPVDAGRTGGPPTGLLHRLDAPGRRPRPGPHLRARPCGSR